MEHQLEIKTYTILDPTECLEYLTIASNRGIKTSWYEDGEDMLYWDEDKILYSCKLENYARSRKPIYKEVDKGEFLQRIKGEFSNV